MSELGRRLKQFRELAGLSQNELSKRSGVPRPTITHIESGVQEGVTLDNARKLARALGITIDLLAGKGEDASEVSPTVAALA
jgi:HTH-type transcriptional regulator, repressor for puuD